MTKFLTSPEEWTLCFVTMLWGVSFLLIRMALEDCGPLFFVGLRFSFAALGLLLCSFPLMSKISRRELVGGSILGVAIFLGFGLQTMGLVEVQAAKSAFISSLYVPLVPLFELLLMRHKPRLMAWIGMALAFVGVVLLADPQSVDATVGRGEVLTFLCAVVFALEIVLTGILVPGTNPRRMAIVEVTVTALLSFICMPLFGETVPQTLSAKVVWIGLGLGLMTAFIQSVVVWAQKRISPTRASIIYTGEPVFGGLFGYLAGERLAGSAWFGCACVLCGILVSTKKGDAKEGEEQKR